MKASEGVRRIDVAVTRAHQSIDAAASMFSGTVPPKPWPSPELYRALDDVADARDRLDVFVRKGDPDFKEDLPQVKFIMGQIQSRIDAVNKWTDALDERRGVVAKRTPTAVVAQFKAAVSTNPVKLLLGAGLVYLLLEGNKRPRRR